MGICKLCGKNKQLAESHIIPESMYPFEGEPREPLSMVAYAPNTPVKRSAAGEYDPALVCMDCEAIFSPWDDYAFELLRKEPARADYTYLNGESRAYTIDSFNYEKLKLFFVSLLWRASESNRPFFQDVHVGSTHAAILKHMINARLPGDPEDYSVFIVRLAHKNNDAHRSVMCPFRRRWEGIRFYRFMFFGYIFDIKVDKQDIWDLLCETTGKKKAPAHAAGGESHNPAGGSCVAAELMPVREGRRFSSYRTA